MHCAAHHDRRLTCMSARVLGCSCFVVFVLWDWQLGWRWRLLAVQCCRVDGAGLILGEPVLVH